MQDMIRAWFKYFIFAGLFGLCINLIYLALPVYVMTVYDRVLFSFSRATLFALAGGVGISLVFMGVLEYVKKKMLIQAGTDLVDRMLPRVLNRMAQGYERGARDLETLRRAVVRGTLMGLMDLPWGVVYLWILYLVHPLMGAVAGGAVFIAVTARILLGLLEKRRYTISDVAFHANAGMVGQVLEKSFLVKGMGMLPAVVARYKERERKGSALAGEADGFHAFIGTFIGLVHILGTAGVFTAGAYVFFADEISAGALVASLLVSARIFVPMDRALESMREAIEAGGAYKRLKTFAPEDKALDKFSLPEPKGQLTLEGAGLALEGKAILNNINLDLAPGEFLGVLGPSDAGKTALCRMILGIFPAVAGKVRVDGAEIAHWPEGELGRHVGYMPQEPELFEGRVADNIARLGPPDPEGVVAAAQKAGAHEMILKLPQGYDTRLARNGKNLSAGRRRLISLARALYGSPRLLVLDDPTAFLDEDGFKRLAGALNRAKQDKTTVVMVTDKTNLLAGSDKILVIKEGQAAMYGPAKDVLAQLTGQNQPARAAGV